MRRAALTAVGLLLLIYFLSKRENSAAPVTQSRLAMGTAVTAKLYVERQTALPLFDRAFAVIGRIDSMMSRHDEDSALNRINARAAAGPVECVPELIQVLNRCQYFARRTEGAFDITVGALARLWDFPDAVAPPEADLIRAALERTGYQHLQLVDETVFFAQPGLFLDLGAAAKGFAVDRAVDALQQEGVPCGLIEAGGDIRYWGQKPDGRPWNFGIYHPRDANRLVEVEDLGLNALATSGDYEQFFEREGQRFHHILDPSTGYPAGRAVSATVWAETAMDADILSTAVFVLGPERGLELVESLSNTETLVFFERDGQLQHRASSGVEGHYRFRGGGNPTVTIYYNFPGVKRLETRSFKSGR